MHIDESGLVGTTAGLRLKDALSLVFIPFFLISWQGFSEVRHGAPLGSLFEKIRWRVAGQTIGSKKMGWIQEAMIKYR